ncbi:helix-turn-helix transcriptional regulator [Shewanella corallii]|uniref:Helix-turn-helix transcriptional regulator n=1 Tax=Shewanella corallii TaxID=560080 RepID=A0ABT0N3H0_9GAMM|nr:helix-turn-helix domain-containing protein [Shewanella corallii]MCL2912993.1 helix-turn-helix transcriptional regulator [Shewanella corallii]
MPQANLATTIALQKSRSESFKTLTTPVPKPRVEITGCDAPCPIEQGMRLIGGKWKASILWHLQGEGLRFNEVCRQVPGASKKIVDARLKELEADGMISRHVLSDKPIAVAYRITPRGQSLLSILNQLKDWVMDDGK